MRPKCHLPARPSQLWLVGALARTKPESTQTGPPSPHQDHDCQSAWFYDHRRCCFCGPRCCCDYRGDCYYCYYSYDYYYF